VRRWENFVVIFWAACNPDSTPHLYPLPFAKGRGNKPLCANRPPRPAGNIERPHVSANCFGVPTFQWIEESNWRRQHGSSPLERGEDKGEG